MSAPTFCHCEPVLTLVWQSVFPLIMKNTDSHDSDIGHCLGMTGFAAGHMGPALHGYDISAVFIGGGMWSCRRTVT